jgi:hypothetical protein
MSKSSFAGAVIFGFEFQVDAAICLFIRSIENIDQIKVEGKFQDIELLMKDGSKTFCQVKSIYNPSSVRSLSKFREAAYSLAETPIGLNDSYLYCSNQLDSFISGSSCFSVDSILEYSFVNLEEGMQKIVEKYFSKKKSKKWDKFKIIKIPYNISSNAETKKAHIINEIKKFLIAVREDESRASLLIKDWHGYFENSAEGIEEEFVLKKERIIWMIIASLLSQSLSKVIINDETLRYDVEKRYDNLISFKICNFEISNKIIGLYIEQLPEKKWKSFDSFTDFNLRDLTNFIFQDETIGEIELITVYAITSAILSCRTRIERIKAGAKL